MSVKVTALGYYRLMVNGQHFSNHSQEREGIEKSSHILEITPEAIVTLTPPIVKVESSKTGVTTPNIPGEPVLSDAGEDLIDFIDRMQGPPTSYEKIIVDNFYAGVEAFIVKTKATWLVRRLYWEVNGEKIWVGIGWRGYILIWHKRDKTAIRVGLGG